MYTILTINPGSTSTKLGLYHCDKQMHLKEVFLENIAHNSLELKQFNTPLEQLDFRFKYINKF